MITLLIVWITCSIICCAFTMYQCWYIAKANYIEEIGYFPNAERPKFWSSIIKYWTYYGLSIITGPVGLILMLVILAVDKEYRVNNIKMMWMKTPRIEKVEFDPKLEMEDSVYIDFSNNEIYYYFWRPFNDFEARLRAHKFYRSPEDVAEIIRAVKNKIDPG